MATSEVESVTDRKPLLANGSFAYMLAQYGFEFDNHAELMGYYGANPNALGRNIILSPIYLLKNGNIDEIGVSRYPGEGTWHWTTSAGNWGLAANVRLYHSELSTASVWYHFCGFSLRCSERGALSDDVYA